MGETMNIFHGLHPALEVLPTRMFPVILEAPSLPSPMSVPTKEIHLITCILNKWKTVWYCSRNQKGYDSGKHKIQTTQMETK